MSIEFDDFGSANLDRQVRAAKKQKAGKTRKKKDKREAKIQKAILEYMGYRFDLKMFRMNAGKIVTKFRGTIQLAPEGTADIIGAREITITQDMVGETFAQFVACEIKVPDPKKTYPSDVQREFLELVRDMGGLAFVARSVDDVIEMLPYEIDPDVVQLESVR